MKSYMMPLITVALFAVSTASAQYGYNAGVANYGSYGGYGGCGNGFDFGFNYNSCNFADSLWTDYCNGGPGLGARGCGHGGSGFGGCGYAGCGWAGGGHAGCGHGGCGHSGALRGMLSRRPLGGGGHGCCHRGRRSAGNCAEEVGCADNCEADCGYADPAVPGCGYSSTGCAATPDCGFASSAGCGCAPTGCGGACCGGNEYWWYGYGTPRACGRLGHGCHARQAGSVACADGGRQSGFGARQGCGGHQGCLHRLFGRGRHHLARNSWVGGGPLDNCGLVAAYEFPGSCVDCSFGGCGDLGGYPSPAQNPADAMYGAPSTMQPEVSPENSDPAFDADDSYSPLDDDSFSSPSDDDVEPLPGAGSDDA